MTYIEPKGDENIIHFVDGSKMATRMGLDDLEDRIANFVRSPTIAMKKFRPPHSE
ncbi:MAG: hypothetical protein HC788_11560 [Sphingopyxis sp.]|nr:hypothetical protein [Sphingopyxis sp.]